MRAIAYFTAAVLTFLFSSCHSEPTLQQYFVEKSEESPFIAMDIPPSIFGTDAKSLTTEEKAALDSFQKLNVLVFPLQQSSEQTFITERDAVNRILQNPKYEELMSFGSGKDKGSLRFVGTQDDIEEFVIFMSQKEAGFAVVRIIGDDMSPDAVMALMGMMNKINLNSPELAPLQAVFEANKPKT